MISVVVHIRECSTLYVGLTGISSDNIIIFSGIAILKTFFSS